MKTEITIKKQVNRKNLLVWLNSTEISLKNLTVWLIYVKFVEKKFGYFKKVLYLCIIKLTQKNQNGNKK